MTDLKDQLIATLEEENDTLREQVRQLEQIAYNTEWVCPVELCLTPTEARLVAALMTRELCTTEHLHLATSRDGLEAETDRKIVDVFVCKARKKLEPFGIKIHTHWGLGYSMSQTDIERLKNWNTHERPENGIRTIDSD